MPCSPAFRTSLSRGSSCSCFDSWRRWGIGGEWAVGASLLSETWPRSWRPWIAAVLQTGVNIGVLIAATAGLLLSERADRTVFLVGIAPALLVFWIRRQVPETAEWSDAKLGARGQTPSLLALFGPQVWRTSVLTNRRLLALAHNPHWAFMYWGFQHLRRVPGVVDLVGPERQMFGERGADPGDVRVDRREFLRGPGWRSCGAIACRSGDVPGLFPRHCGGPIASRASIKSCLCGSPCADSAKGVFALFTMYMPPLFPTLLRTTGSGILLQHRPACRRGGHCLLRRICDADGFRHVLLNASYLFLAAMLFSAILPEAKEELPRTTGEIVGEEPFAIENLEPAD